MFESLKKKFSKTSKKLTEKITKEAKDENNIESVDLETSKKDQLQIEEGQKLKDENVSEVDDDEDWDDIFEEEEKKPSEKPSFLSIFSKNKQKKDSKKEEVSTEDKQKKDSKKEEVTKDDVSDLSDSPDEENIDSSNDKSTIDEDLIFHDDDDDDDEVDPLVAAFDAEVEKRDYKEDVKAEDISKEIEKEKTVSEPQEKKSSVFSFVKEKSLSESDVEDILWELELGLLEGDVAIDVANAVVESVKNDLIGQKIKRSSDVGEYTYKALQKAVAKIINVDGKSMTDMIEDKKREGKPLVVMFVGINGTGKTTTIGKLSNYYLKKGYTPVIAASDTFRAGAIEQVTQHADNVGVKIIKHQKGSDPAAVAYDAVEHANAQGKELVLIDTAGRMQTNVNLMDEMKKIKRVAKPDLVIFVGDALTGNDATEQAEKFNNAIDIDGVILTKADADAKGGASLSIGYVINKPILFLGMGQGYDDIMEYSPEWMLNQLFS